VRFKRKALGRGVITMATVDELSHAIKFNSETQTGGQPWEALAHFLGDRFGKDS